MFIFNVQRPMAAAIGLAHILLASPIGKRTGKETVSQTFQTRSATALACAALAWLMHLPALAAVQFEDRSAAAGLGPPQETYGASWGDLNGDGYPDLFVSNHRAPPHVLVNRGDGTFFDNQRQVITWVNKKNSDTHGGSWSDFDNDGDLDLLITAGTGNDQQLFVNERGDLVDRSVELGLAQPQLGGRLPLWLDYDDDGRPDVVITQFAGDSPVYRQGNSGFGAVSAGVRCSKIQYGHLLDVNGDGRLDILCADDAQFPRDVYDTSTFPFRRITSEFPVVNQVVDSVVADFDNNGEMDVLLINNTELRPSEASQPRSDTVEALLAGSTKSFSFSGPDRVTVDVNWKGIDTTFGLTEIVVGAESTEPVFAMPFTLDASDRSVHGIPPTDPERVPFIRIGYDTSVSPPRWTFISDTTNVEGGTEYDEMYYVVEGDAPIDDLRTTGINAADGSGPPTLLLNDGTNFNDATAASGLQEDISCVSVAAGDFDNDGDVDVYIACRTGTRNIINRYYDNDGTGRFTLVPNAGGATGPLGSYITDGAGTADSVVVADYDVDGFLDLFVTNGFNLRPRELGGPKSLYRNSGNGNHWLQLDLVGAASRDAVGAIVRVTADGLTQTRVVDGGYHRWSQNHQRLHVGLGSATRADVTVIWPGGFTETHMDVPANAVYTATEGGGIAEAPPGGGVPYACGAPEVDAGTARGVYLWQDCYLGYWRVRFAAAGASETFRGRVQADVPFDTVNQVGQPNTLDWTSTPGTLVFDITEANGRFKGFNFRPGDGAASHCLQLDAPADAPVFYGPLAQRLNGGPIELETGEGCDAVAPIVSVAGGTASESDGSVDFTVTLSRPLDQEASVRAVTRDGSATSGSDYQALDTTVTFPAGVQTRTVTVTLLDDAAVEGEETFSLVLSEARGVDLGIASASATIRDDETVACGMPSYDAGSEAGIFLWQSCGGSGQWNVRFTAGGGSADYAGTVSSTSALTDVSGVSLEDSDIVDAVTDPAVIRYDLFMVGAGQDGFSFRPAPGAATCFDAPDSAGGGLFVGPDRTPASAPFDLATLGPCRSSGDAVLSVSPTSASEADPALVFTVKLSETVDAEVTFDYSVSGTTATAGEDFTDPGPGSGSIPVGSTTTMISVPLIDDTQVEGEEVVRLTVSNVQGAVGGTLQADGTIRDDDEVQGGTPRLDAVALVAAEDAGTGSFELTLSEASSTAASVDVAVVSGTATAGEDFVPVETTIVFAAGQTRRTVPVTLVDDALAEGLETLRLLISNPQGLQSDVDSIEGLIEDDEPSPCGEPLYDPSSEAGFFLWKDCENGAWHLRTAAGSRQGGARFDGGIRSTLPWQNVSGHSVESTDVLAVSTSPARIDFGFDVFGQWLDGIDFTPAGHAATCFTGTGSVGDTVTVGAGRTPLTPPFDLSTLGPCDVVPRLGVSPATANEGDALVFHVNLDAPAAGEVAFDYQTGNGSAEAGSDYLAAQGSATIPLGSLGTTIAVATLADAEDEGSETLTLGLGNASGATLGTAEATGTIVDGTDGAGEDPTCGMPALDPQNESVLAVWRDCASDEWHVRAIAGGSGFLTYPGAVDSSTGFASFAGDSLEPDDTLSQSSDTRLLYRLNLSPPHHDGFRFRLNGGAEACFHANLPAGTRLVVGAGRVQPATTSFDLATLGACGP